MNTELTELLTRYLRGKASDPHVERNIMAFSHVFSQTVHYRNDVVIVPALMQFCKDIGLSLCFEDMGIAASPQQLADMAEEIHRELVDAVYDYSHFDGLDAYSAVQVIHINLVKIHNWAASLFGKLRLSDLVHQFIEEMSVEEVAALRGLSGKRIGFLGDSGMISNHWSTQVGYPDLLSAVCDHLSLDVTCVNAGIGGNKSNQGLRRLESDVLVYDVDLCFVAFGGNDSAFNAETGDFVVPLADYETNMRAIITTLRSRGVHTVLGVPSKKEKYHTSEADYLKYVEIVLRLADEESVDTYDLFNCFSDEMMGACISVDGIHMNTLGQMQMAKVALAYLTTSPLS